MFGEYMFLFAPQQVGISYKAKKEVGNSRLSNHIFEIIYLILMQYCTITFQACL